MALPAGGPAPVINKHPPLPPPGAGREETCQSLLPIKVENSHSGSGTGARSCLQPGLVSLGTSGTPLATSLPPSVWLLCSPCLLLLFIPRAGLLDGPLLGGWGGVGEATWELWSCSCNATCISWGVSSMAQLDNTQRGGGMWELHQELGCCWESYGSILEICGAVWLAVLEGLYWHLLGVDQGY